MGSCRKRHWSSPRRQLSESRSVLHPLRRGTHRWTRDPWSDVMVMWAFLLVAWGMLPAGGNALSTMGRQAPLGYPARHFRKPPVGMVGSLRRKRDENERSSGSYGRGVAFYLNEPCNRTCNNILYHIYCNEATKQCECQPDYPISVDNRICAKAAGFGSSCEHTESCDAVVSNSACIGAICQCKEGFYKSTAAKNVSCDPGVRTNLVNNSDVMTMVSVISGLIVFTGLFCLVLRLFSKQRFGQPQDRLGTGAGPPVVMTGVEPVPLRRSSITSSRRLSRSSVASNECQSGSRRASYGMLAPPSNSGSRRASSASVRSQSSLRSYSSFRSQASFRSYRSARDPVRRTASSPADPQVPLAASLTLGRRSPSSASARALAPSTEVPLPEKEPNTK